MQNMFAILDNYSWHGITVKVQRFNALQNGHRKHLRRLQINHVDRSSSFIAPFLLIAGAGYQKHKGQTEIQMLIASL